MANAHQLDYGEQGTNAEDDTVTTGVEDMSPPDDEASHEYDASPADLRNVLLTSSKRAADKPRQAAVAEENFVGAVLDGGLTVDSYVWYVNQVDLSKCQPEAHHVKPGEHDWETLRRLFSWASVKSIEKTFQTTMQMG